MRRLLQIVAVFGAVSILFLSSSVQAKGAAKARFTPISVTQSGCNIECGEEARNASRVEYFTASGDTERCCKACLSFCEVEACEAWGPGTYVYCEAQEQ